jgi:hypothetical protein
VAEKGTAQALSDAETRPATALVVGTDDWAIEQLIAKLVATRHDTLRCHEPGEPAFPCNAFIEGRRCPLDVGFDVVVTVRARPLQDPAPAETGVTCALRAGIPVVVAGMIAGNPFRDVATGVVSQAGDVSAACDAAAVRAQVVDLRGVRTP